MTTTEMLDEILHITRNLNVKMREMECYIKENSKDDEISENEKERIKKAKSINEEREEIKKALAEFVFRATKESANRAEISVLPEAVKVLIGLL